MSTLPPVPHSEEAERAVLAAVLLKPEILDDLEITTTDFYSERHRLIFGTMLELSADRQPVDLRTLQAQLEQRGAFQQIGGFAYLAGMDLDLPDLDRVETYAGIVRERAGRRRLLDTAQRLAQQAYGSGELTAGELAARYLRELEDLQDSGGVDSGAWASDLLGGVLEDAAERRRQREETGEAVLGLKTGIPRLDGLLCGLQRGLYLLAGPPGMGKTSLALQIALQAAQEVPVIFVTYENTGANLLQKALCSRAGLPMRDVTRGYADLEKLGEAAAELRSVMERLILIDGDSRLTVGRLRARARRALEVRGVKRCLVVIDYLQLWAKVSRELRELTDVRAKVDTLGGELISLARRLDSPVLAISSQNRASGNYGSGGGRAALDSLKESGDLEYSADAALFLTESSEREVDAPAKALDLTLRKHRHGPTGEVKLVFQPDRGVFREEETRYF